MKGVYQHCGDLQRYLAEFDFRYNNVPRWDVATISAPSEPIRQLPVERGCECADDLRE
jgi:hypothetical protein